jgi:hypothetical protein
MLERRGVVPVACAVMQRMPQRCARHMQTMRWLQCQSGARPRCIARMARRCGAADAPCCLCSPPPPPPPPSPPPPLSHASLSCYLVYIWSREYEGVEVNVNEMFNLKAELLPWFFVAQVTPYTYSFSTHVHTTKSHYIDLMYVLGARHVLFSVLFALLCQDANSSRLPWLYVAQVSVSNV